MTYRVNITDRSLGPGGGSVISQINGSSDFRYNFNAAWLPLPDHLGGGLFLRVTDTNTNAGLAAHSDGAGGAGGAGSGLGRSCSITTANSSQSHSMIAFVRAISDDGLQFEKVTRASLVVPVAPSLDPRATYRALTGEYFLTYQCNFAHGAELLRKTFVARTLTPENASSWIDMPTPIFRDVEGEERQDCGTCVFFPEDHAISDLATGTAKTPPAYVLATFGGLRGGNLSLAVSHDNLSSWQTQTRPLLATRASHWDNRTLSSGPCPLRLSDGNWLVLYNVDNKWPVDDPAPIPKYGRCALGWAVLDGDISTGKVLARASEPLLWGDMPFDKSSYDSGPSVYTDGVRSLGNDTFIVYAGGADQVVEAVRIQVSKVK
jgi:predicted GH43/DUF377 family glycosyl hydrolase